ncbi:sigma-54-dependent Fis family transcriptional regulator [Methylobacillus arboreus]|uniref:sigma-54-dependent Fis family transcriptional regulator n=1 Tax=Methylobacillus arboreus TaxID=755170 RepID=UPI001E47CC56|nr:sigma-54-dependent Fis family transcriptional regulator [Methylobacillus arboreus]MCB5191115.1 sigma-54-dependent Fis family transcriptional regulator [Methylobacillus arboreus]
MTKSLQQIGHARRQFLAQGDMQEGVVNKTIAQSWRRSLKNGISASQPLSTAILNSAELDKKRSKNRLLLTQAKPEITTLYEQIAHSHSVVALTDAEGTILHSQGQHLLTDLAPSELLSPGYSWCEQQRGTNAIGTAIVEKQAVAVQGAEHFVEQLHSFSCYAVPIFGPNQQLLGTLNVSNAFSTQQPHTLALVKMAAQLIENRIFRACHQGPVRLHFHTHSDFVNTQWEGIAVFSRQGELLAINRHGLSLLDLQDIPGDFQSIFAESFTGICNQSQQNVVLNLRQINGEPLHAVLEIEADPSANDRIAAIRTSSAPTGLLVEMTSDDPRIAEVLSQARLVMNQDIPILIQGETGVGKELLASAIHRSSARAHGPLVAVNCAALPEGLIEAELFGYEEGAFTGARQKGSQGKMEQAHGGTLFLDEIGDMPLLLQARLLRVLQERSVTPLGGSKARKLDFAVISATNQKLQEKVASGAFRKDLYYRLNGISLTLPPLRERQDLNALVNHIMAAEGASEIEIHEEVLALFRQHPWPGNIRQLHNVLKTMLALAAGKPLGRQHLPPGFMEELGSITTEQAATAALSAGSIDDITNEAVRLALQHHEGNISAAARELGMSRNRFYRKLKALGLA